MLGSGSLHAHLFHIDAHSRRQIFPHLVAIGGKFGGLSGNNAVDINDNETERSYVFCHAAQQDHGIGTGISRIGIGEQLADIASARGTEQRIGCGMRKHVCVGMPEKALVMRDIDPTQNELSALRESMDVEAEAHAHIQSARHG